LLVCGKSSVGVEMLRSKSLAIVVGNQHFDLDMLKDSA
jgi:hypothetical protein